MSFLASPGEVTIADVSPCAGDVDDGTELEVLLAPAGEAMGNEYKHSLSDFVHVAHRGLCSSHFTLLRLQVRLFVLEMSVHKACDGSVRYDLTITACSA
jgi:hypothetical protein